MNNLDRLHSLRCVVLAALDELQDLIEPDPAAAFARRAVHRTIACLEQDWLPHLTEAESLLEPPTASGTCGPHAPERAPIRQLGGISERG